MAQCEGTRKKENKEEGPLKEGVVLLVASYYYNRCILASARTGLCASKNKTKTRNRRPNRKGECDFSHLFRQTELTLGYYNFHPESHGPRSSEPLRKEVQSRRRTGDTLLTVGGGVSCDAFLTS